jgi:hypothetical protein
VSDTGRLSGGEIALTAGNPERALASAFLMNTPCSSGTQDARRRSKVIVMKPLVAAEGVTGGFGE